MKKKILLADDSTTILMMERMILSREPCEIITAEDGKQALELALSERPDLILLDVVMPEMNGFDVLKRLRAEEPTRTTPVTTMTPSTCGATTTGRGCCGSTSPTSRTTSPPTAPWTARPGCAGRRCTSRARPFACCPTD